MPYFQMLDTPPTPVATLRHVRGLALRVGLRHVDTGNVDDPEGQVTPCTGCGDTLIARDSMKVTGYRLTPAGTCPTCGTALTGRFDPSPGHRGRRRVPVLLEGGP